MQLFDVHSHILPAFDDGAKTIEDSLDLIACLKKQGTERRGFSGIAKRGVCGV